MGKKIRGNGRGYDYFFVRPVRKEGVHEAAKKLMGIESVREVAITEGDCGFVVKAEQSFDERNAVGREIVRTVGGSSRKAACYCQYVRA